jgi:hypothetical protein
VRVVPSLGASTTIEIGGSARTGVDRRARAGDRARRLAAGPAGPRRGDERGGARQRIAHGDRARVVGTRVGDAQGCR